MLLNESPKSNPTPRWPQTIREFIFLGMIPAALSGIIYFINPASTALKFIALIAMVVALRSTIWFVVKVIRMNIDDRKNKLQKKNSASSAPPQQKTLQ